MPLAHGKTRIEGAFISLRIDAQPLDQHAMNAPVEKKEQWEQPDREAVIRDNPLLEYCQRHGLRLKRDGAANRYKCLCPLRHEKTPSFTIFADQGRFHCFGCGRKGNVIDLHAALMGVSGMEALSI